MFFKTSVLGVMVGSSKGMWAELWLRTKFWTHFGGVAIIIELGNTVGLPRSICPNTETAVYKEGTWLSWYWVLVLGFLVSQDFALESSLEFYWAILLQPLLDIIKLLSDIHKFPNKWIALIYESFIMEFNVCFSHGSKVIKFTSKDNNKNKTMFNP